MYNCEYVYKTEYVYNMHIDNTEFRVGKSVLYKVNYKVFCGRMLYFDLPKSYTDSTARALVLSIDDRMNVLFMTLEVIQYDKSNYSAHIIRREEPLLCENAENIINTWTPTRAQDINPTTDTYSNGSTRTYLNRMFAEWICNQHMAGPR